MTDAFIYDHVRTPRGRGKADGSLHEVTPVELVTQVLEAVKTAMNWIPVVLTTSFWEWFTPKVNRAQTLPGLGRSMQVMIKLHRASN